MSTSFVHTARARVEDNGKGGRKLVPKDEQEFRWMLLRFNPGTEILLGAKEWRDKHSPQQRGYLRGVVIPEILRAMGMEDSKENNDVMYLKLKEKFGPCEVKYGKDGHDGEAIIFPKSARDMDTKEMSELIERCIQFAGEFLGITIPPANRVINQADGGGI